MLFDRARIEGALPGYELGDELGRGGWGVVLAARQVALDRVVAIKLLPAGSADADTLARFTDEAQIVGALDHPHVVRVFDFRTEGNIWMIVMEHLPGGSLHDRFRIGGIRADQAIAVTACVCSALHVAHGRGVLHRDVKPDNVLFTADNVPRLADFGIARLAGSDVRRTATGAVIGTPAYMSPEQASGAPVGAASDVYSTAVVLYELLAGTTPFPGATSPTDQLMAHVQQRPVPLTVAAPEVPSLLADVVMTGLEKDPADRFGGAQAFGVALARAAGEVYGKHWLADSGIRLMAGGPIEAAALRGPTMGVAPRQPTQAVPAAPGPRTVGPASTPGIDPAPVPSPAPTPPPAPPPPPTPSSQTADTEPAPPAADTEPASISSAPPADPAVDRRRTGRRWPVVLGLVAAALVLAAIGLRDSGNGDATTGGPSSTASSTAETIADDGAATTTTGSTVPVRTCAATTRCAFIDSIGIVGETLTIEWTAEHFSPLIGPGSFHVHFFWDIYSPAQVGTNAAEYGVTQGLWELTDEQPFVAAGEMVPANRPAEALNICVVVANQDHGVVDPSVVDCAPIPDY